MPYKKDEIALLVNQDAKRVPAKMKLLHKLARENKLKLRLCDGSDLDYELRNILNNKKLKRLIIGGGDGTITKAASLILKKSPKVELAVLPLGTANYYGRSLGLRRNLSHSFHIALEDETEERHICKANNRNFLIGVNVGTASRMFDEVTDDDKKKFGKLAYLRGILRILLKLKQTDLTIKTNGKEITYKFTELVVLNQQIQEPVKLTPDVKGSDPYFEIITYGLGNSKLSPLLAIVIYILTFGRNQKYLKRLKSTEAIIESDSDLPVAIDGDSLESLPLKISMHKKPVVFVKAS